MSQTVTAKAEAAEERTEETRSFVRTVKAASRRKYTPEVEDPHRAGGVPEGGHSE